MKPPYLRTRVHALRGEVDIGGELVGVPAQEHVAGVGVDRAQDAGAAGDFELVLNRVAGERRVIGFQVEFQVIDEIVLAEEVGARGGVGIVLVFGGLLGFRLDVELAGEADLFGVINSHVEKAGEVLQLALHVGVPEILVAFAAAPECVAAAAELFGHFERFLHLGGGEGERVGIGAGGGAVHVAAIAKEVGGAPEQLDAGALLFFLEHFHDFVEIAVCFGKRVAFGCNVAVVKRIERVAELLHELERHASAVFGVLDRVGAVLPGTNGRAGAERIGQRIAERVPVDDAEPQMVAHRFIADFFVRVVVTKSERVLGLGAFETDAFDLGKCGFHVFAWLLD